MMVIFWVISGATTTLIFIMAIDKKHHKITVKENEAITQITIIDAQEQVNRVEAKTIKELGRVDMKDGWQNMDLENQSEINRSKADKKAAKYAKTSEEIAELCEGCVIRHYSPTGEFLGESKS